MKVRRVVDGALTVVAGFNLILIVKAIVDGLRDKRR